MPQARKTDYSVGTSCNISVKTLSKSRVKAFAHRFYYHIYITFTNFSNALKPMLRQCFSVGLH